jgi:hypothetical protein
MIASSITKGTDSKRCRKITPQIDGKFVSESVWKIYSETLKNSREDANTSFAKFGNTKSIVIFAIFLNLF